MATDRVPVTVKVSGWDEMLPLEPLKLSAVVESFALLFVAAQSGVAISIATMGKRICRFTTSVLLIVEWNKSDES